jgi:hypothetical protein
MSMDTHLRRTRLAVCAAAAALALAACADDDPDHGYGDATETGNGDATETDRDSDPDDGDADDGLSDDERAAVAAWTAWVEHFDAALRGEDVDADGDYSRGVYDQAALAASQGHVPTIDDVDAGVQTIDVDGNAARVEACVTTAFPASTDTPILPGVRYLAHADLERAGDGWRVVDVGGIDRILGEDATLTRCADREFVAAVEPALDALWADFIDAMGGQDASFLDADDRIDTTSPDRVEWMALVLDVMADPAARPETQEAGVDDPQVVVDVTFSVAELYQTGGRTFEGTGCLDGPWGVRDTDGTVLMGSERSRVVQLIGIYDHDANDVLLRHARATPENCP